jgi:pimeloyl-ACP methyl ester carboxylesterase
LFHDEGLRHGFRVIATDRPGMGESTYFPNRRLLDYPRDIAELADALGIDRFGVIGWSGGGAHTTVCGYAIPERLLFNISFAGYTNFAEMPGAEKYLESKMDQISVALSKNHPCLFKVFFDVMRLSEEFMPETSYKAFMKVVCDADKKIGEIPEFKRLFMESQAAAFAQGSQGVTTDAAVHYVDWGFRLKEIPVRLHVFHGDEDRLVPIEFGRHICENVPNGEFHVLKGEGHLFPYRYLTEIFDTMDAERATLDFVTAGVI